MDLLKAEIRAAGDVETLYASMPFNQPIPLEHTLGIKTGKTETFLPKSLTPQTPLGLLREHEKNRLITRIRPDDHLRFSDEMFELEIPIADFPDTSEARDAIADLRAGNLSSISPRFRPFRGGSVTRGANTTYSKAILQEISLVFHGAFNGFADAELRDAVDPKVYRWWL